MKSKLCIFINRSSFIGTEKALKIIKSFKKWDSDSKFKDKKKIGLSILDCSISLYKNNNQD
jgi:hypothetical protein